MAQFFAIHPDNPQIRLIQQATDQIREGGVVVLPTDSGYALGCALENKRGGDVIRQIRRLDNNHNFTLLCRDLSQISVYARFENPEYRLLKSHTPGAYTFILVATREVPRRLLHPKRKQIGIRIPDNTLALDLLTMFQRLGPTLFFPPLLKLWQEAHFLAILAPLPASALANMTRAPEISTAGACGLAAAGAGGASATASAASIGMVGSTRVSATLPLNMAINAEARMTPETLYHSIV